MSVRVLWLLVGTCAVSISAALAGPELPCQGCVICEKDVPSSGNPRWTYSYWYDPETRGVKLTVFSNWVPTWYTYDLPDPNCSWEVCAPTPPEPNALFDFVTDCDGNGVPDWCDVVRSPVAPELDCDGDLRLDACQIASDPELDACNRNGIPDRCETETDCDGDGTRDLCQIADCAGDPFCADCDADGIPDGCQWTATSDCDADQILDRCQIERDPNLDCNLDGVLDNCDPAPCPLPTLLGFLPPDPELDCDAVALVKPCGPALFALGPQDAGCALVEVTQREDGVYVIRLRGCAAQETIDLQVLEGACADTLPVVTDWEDCNENDRADRCELQEGTAEDCDQNAVPDECEDAVCNFRAEIEAIGPDARGQYLLQVGHCGPVDWELVGNEAQCAALVPLRPVGFSQRARLGGCLATGWVTVRATSRQDPTCVREAELYLGCPDCGSCGSEPGSVALGSLRALFPLGSTPQGGSYGALQLTGETPEQVPVQPGSLRLPVRHAETLVQRSVDGTIEAVLTPRHRFDVVTIAGGFAIEVRSRQTGAPDTAPPLRCWRVRDVSTSAFAVEIGYEQDGALQHRDVASGAYGSDDWTLIRYDATDQLVQRQTLRWEGVVRKRRVWRDGGLAESVDEHYDPTRTHLRRTVIDPNNAALTTVQRFGVDGRLQARHLPDGGWQAFRYDMYGRIVWEKRGWLDAALPIGGDPNGVPGRTLRYSYRVPYDPNAQRPDPLQPFRIEESIAGQPVRTWHLTDVNVAVDPNAGLLPGLNVSLCNPNDGSACQQTTVVFDPDDLSRLRGFTRGDQTFTRIDYRAAQIQFDATGQPQLVVGDGLPDVVTETLRLPAGMALPLAGWSTRTRATQPGALPGWRMREESVFLPEAGTSDGFTLLAWRLEWLDEWGRVRAVRDSSGATQTISWEDCCFSRQVQSSRGPTWREQYDTLGRLLHAERSPLPHVPGLVTTRERIAQAGLWIDTRTERDLASGVARTTTRTLDRVGRMVAACDALDRCEEWAYTRTPNGGRRVVRTRPDGATETHEYYRDGQLKSIQGPGVVDRWFRYRMDETGALHEVERLGQPDGPRWIERIYDPFGRPIEVRQPVWDRAADPNTLDAADTLTRTFDYDAVPADGIDDGLLVAEHLYHCGQQQLAPLRYEYTPMGELARIGRDHDDDGVLAEAPGEAALAFSRAFIWRDGRVWRQHRADWVADDVPERVWQEVLDAPALGGQPRISHALGSDGQATTTTYQHDDETKRTTVTTVRSDRATNGTPLPSGIVVQSMVGERLLEHRAADGAVHTWEYDAFGQRRAAHGPAGTFTATYHLDGRLATAVDADGQRTSYTYDDVTGRLARVTDVLQRDRHYAWTAGGQLHRMWGAGIHPLELRYDVFGDLVAANTFRSSDDWFGPSWPTDPVADVDLWIRDAATGLVSAREDPLGRRQAFQYDALGRRTQLVAQDEGQPATRSFQYDASVGWLKSVHYGDAIDAHFTYRSDGLPTTITDGSGTRRFVYDDAQEVRAIHYDVASLLPDRTLRLRRRFGNLRQPMERIGLWQTGSGLGVLPQETRQLIVRGPDGREHESTYDFDRTTGRVTAMSFAGRLVSFLYDASGWLQETRWSDGSVTRNDTSSGHEVRYAGAHGAATFAYALDGLGRRTQELATGLAAENQDELTHWFYNERDELVRGQHYRLAPGYDPGLPTTEWGMACHYDAAGNRLWQRDPNNTATYDAADQRIDGGRQYDPRGRLLRDAHWRYAWNVADRLVAVDPLVPVEGSQRFRFRYDVEGRRIERRVERLQAETWDVVGTRRWLWLGWRPLVAYDVDAEGTLRVAEELGWGPAPNGGFTSAPATVPLLRRTEDGTEHLLTDGLGRTRLRLQAGGVDRVETDAFGKPRGSDAGAFSWRIPGQQYDHGWGGSYGGHRHYLPSEGRWMQPDPLDLLGGGHPYRFVGNQPTRFVDPLGLCGVDLRSLAMESPEFARRANLPPLVQLEQAPLQLPSMNYRNLGRAAGGVVDTVGGQLPRLAGVGGVIGGGAEVALGTLAIKCSGGTAWPLGTMLIGHGLDGIQAGGRAAWSNRPVDTLTFGVGDRVGSSLFGDSGGLLVGTTLDLGIGLGGPLRAGQIARLGRVRLPGAIDDCCCCELQFVQADAGPGDVLGVLSRRTGGQPQLGVVLDQTNELRVRIGNQILELDFFPIQQHDGTLHLMDLDVIDSVGGPNQLGNGVLLQLLNQLRQEAGDLGYSRLRITGYRTTGASPARPVDRCWDLN